MQTMPNSRLINSHSVKDTNWTSVTQATVISTKASHKETKTMASVGVANPFCVMFATLTLSDNESVAVHLVFRNVR